MCAGARQRVYLQFFYKIDGGWGARAPPIPPCWGAYTGMYVNFMKKLKVGIWAPVQAYRGVGYGGICAPIVNLPKKLKVGGP